MRVSDWIHDCVFVLRCTHEDYPVSHPIPSPKIWKQRKPLPRSQKPIATGPVKRKRAGVRRGPLRDPKYLAFVREFVCVACSRGSVHQPYNLAPWPRTEAAHVGDRGLGQKCSDRETITLCAVHHRTGLESHHVLGKSFWKHHGLDKAAIVAELNRIYEQERGK